MDSKIQLSIIICTCDRADLLSLSLQSVAEAHKNYPVLEVIIVDNGSTDHTKEVSAGFQQALPIRYLFEANIGLSYARNTGAKAAQGDWILYLDDDGKVYPDIFAQTLEVIHNYDFDVVSGIYHPWYRIGKPKWMPKGFGSYHVYEPVEIRPLGRNHLAGNIMLVKSVVLKELGYFHVNLGMKGSAIGYGEDSYLEHQARQAGYKLGLNPYMQMDHLVGSYKMKISWILKSEFQSKKDKYPCSPYPTSTLPKKVLSVFIRFFQFFFVSLWRLMTKENYYWQNAVLDWLMPIARQCGKIYSIIMYGILKKEISS